MATYKVKPTLKAKPKKFPLSSKLYEQANAEADVKEKKKYPKGYEELKEMEKTMKRTEIMGHINKAGKVYVSKAVPKNRRKEVAEHDINERKVILKNKRARK